jgi:hypothetical protein
MLREANLQAQRLAPVLTKLKNVNVFHHPKVPQGASGIDTSRFLRDIKGGGQFCVGEFEDEEGRPALLIVNCSLTQATTWAITPKKSTPMQRVSAYTGKIRPIGAEDNWLAPAGGVLLLLRP